MASSFGGNQFGQLGTGCDQGEVEILNCICFLGYSSNANLNICKGPATKLEVILIFETLPKLLENVNVKTISCGAHHTAVITG